MLDVLNSVGLGESVLKMIERRHRTDLYIAVGGMVRSRPTYQGYRHSKRLDCAT